MAQLYASNKIFPSRAKVNEITWRALTLLCVHHNARHMSLYICPDSQNRHRGLGETVTCLGRFIPPLHTPHPMGMLTTTERLCVSEDRGGKYVHFALNFSLNLKLL